ncbi:hypothetical protein B0H13DRAFT_1932001 [Mycena leptocephala]|nr:hypothetical protein B0H13DRAFT_1932001 [Mycena leptocephala]
MCFDCVLLVKYKQTPIQSLQRLQLANWRHSELNSQNAVLWAAVVAAVATTLAANGDDLTSYSPFIQGNWQWCWIDTEYEYEKRQLQAEHSLYDILLLYHIIMFLQNVRPAIVGLLVNVGV